LQALDVPLRASAITLCNRTSVLLERRGSIVSHLVTNRAVDSHNVFIGHCNSVPKRICIGFSIVNRQHHEVPRLDYKPAATV